MAKNKFKVSKKRKKKDNFFSWLEKTLKLDQLLGPGMFIKYVPHACFVTLLGVITIWHNHQAEKTIRQIDRLEEEVEDLRADYTTLDADYMLQRKQSEVAKRVKSIGLKEIEKPLKRIVIKD
ncbi:MAG: FtsL-like putative cell division protein [Cyclobacteriaceae bacterium]